jgi:hypothetical protein
MAGRLRLIGSHWISETKMSDGRHDFDFFHGSWRIHNRRLVRRLEKSDKWEEFEATGACQPIFGGVGNVDSFSAILPDRSAFEGASYRLFNPKTGLWSIYWADDRSCVLFPPVSGRFRDGVGEFFGDDTHDGRPVRVVFHWTDMTATSAHWQQAFSADNGATWETNWHMFFTRVG